MEITKKSGRGVYIKISARKYVSLPNVILLLLCLWDDWCGV